MVSKGFFWALADEVIYPGSARLTSHRQVAVIALLTAVLLLLLSLSLLLSGTPKRFLNYSEDKYKVAFVSGNFTAAVTRDIPRVVFGHTHPVLSPEFGVSCPRLYLFNDTNGDGVFSKSEATYTSYLDSHHVKWNMSSVEFGNDPGGNEYARVWMSTEASLYAGTEDVSDSPLISDWAVITFNYRISGLSANYSNAIGTYAVSGRTEMTMDFSITLLKPVASEGVVFEMYVNGGGSTNMISLRESSDGGIARLVNVSSSVDESTLGTNFTHRFMSTDRPLQDIYVAKEDGIVQAFYHFGSAPTNGSGARAGIVRMNSSYYTDGAGLVLDQAFFLTNTTDVVMQESSLGIDEIGFNVSVKDWFQDHLPMLMVVGGTIAAAILIPSFIILHRRYRNSRPGTDQDISRKPRMP